MNKNIVIIVAALAIILLGGLLWYQSANNVPAPAIDNSNNQQPAQNNQQTDNNSIGGQVEVEISVPKTHEITYTDSGYMPSELTIKAGDTVVFKNQSTGNVWTGSAMHPTHTVYSGTTLQAHCPDPENNDFDQCKAEGPGTSWSFTFTKKGTWGYHNHVTANRFGKVIVE